MKFNKKDLASGLVFLSAGAFYLVYTLNTLSMGRALNMGPGYFPVVLSGITALIGLAVIATSFGRGDTAPFDAVPWRAVSMIVLSLLFFAICLSGLGLFPTVLIAVTIASGASRETTLGQAAIGSLCIATFCTLVFGYGLGLPIPVFGPWLGA